MDVLHTELGKMNIIATMVALLVTELGETTGK
jgi:hypothetical protein